MARFKGHDLYLNDGDQIYFGDNAEAAVWSESGELHLSSTISGVDPIKSYHLVTKHYVDQRGFTNLVDTPATYSGNSGKYLRVKEDESGIDYNTVNSLAEVQFGPGRVQLSLTSPPTFSNFGPLGVLMFDTNDSVFGDFKVPDTYIENSNIAVEIYYMTATNQSGINYCRWRLVYHTYQHSENYSDKSNSITIGNDTLPNGAQSGLFREFTGTLYSNDVNNPLNPGCVVAFSFSRQTDTMTGQAALVLLVFRIDTWNVNSYD